MCVCVCACVCVRVCVCVLLSLTSHQQFLCNHWTEFNLGIHIFLFLDEDYAPKKFLGPFDILGLFGPFSDLHFFKFAIFFVFKIFNNVTDFSYNIYLKGDVKTFNLTIFWMLFHAPLHHTTVSVQNSGGLSFTTILPKFVTQIEHFSWVFDRFSFVRFVTNFDSLTTSFWPVTPRSANSI